MTIVQAINNAIDIKLAEDKDIVVFGEDVGFEGGVFRVTEGLQKNMVSKEYLILRSQNRVLLGLVWVWL